MIRISGPTGVTTTQAAVSSFEPVVRAPDGPLLHPLIAGRRSPRSLGGEAIADAVLERMLQAARWAPSSSNKQPWGFIVARREDEEAHARVSELLMHGNRLWAPKAPRAGETAPRSRRPLAEIAFEGRFGTPLPLRP